MTITASSASEDGHKVLCTLSDGVVTVQLDLPDGSTLLTASRHSSLILVGMSGPDAGWLDKALAEKGQAALQTLCDDLLTAWDRMAACDAAKSAVRWTRRLLAEQIKDGAK